MTFWGQLCVLALLVSCAAAQNTAGEASEVKDLQVRQDGSEIAIEVTLSAGVTPRVETAVHPDRLVLILPGTLSDARQRRIPVNAKGVKDVRIGLHSVKPPVTRVVVDLEHAQPYTLQTDGSRVTLRVQGALNARGRAGAPSPAASGAILGSVFRRTPPPPPQSDGHSDSASNSIPVPPSLPPIQFPEGQTSGEATTTANTSAPAHGSAAHPKLGSLQQGTVFPEMGAPGTGAVPAAANSQNAGGQTAAAQPAPAQNTAAPASAPVANAPAREQSAASVATPAPNPTPTVAVPPPTSAATPAPTTMMAAAPASAEQPVTTTAGTVAASATTSPPAPTTPGATVAPPATAPAPAVDTAARIQAPAPAATPAAIASAATAQGAPTAAPTPSTTEASAQAPATPASSAPAVATVANPLAGVQLYPMDKAPPEEVIDAPENGNSTTASSTVTPPSATASAPQDQPSSTNSSDSSGAAGQAVAVAKAEPAAIPELALRRANPDFRIAFRVKYVASGAAYLDGGRAAGLAEGMKLMVRDTPGGVVAVPADGSDPTAIAELEVVSVAESSAVTDIHSPKRDVKAGDVAYLSVSEQEALVQKDALSATRKYPAVIAFTEGDTLDDEVRAEVPRPPSPAVNRARGRLGVDYMGTVSHGQGGGTSTNLGLVARLDITRLNGTFWNVSGYWRGRLTASSYTGQQTLQDLINRTYHLSMTYDNPGSPWVAGFGRMYLPWATSLDTIDGGYFGRRLGHGSTLGVFAGSTPDPTSYSYNPNQEIAGGFINFEGGSFDSLKYTSTAGAGISMLKWSVQNPFVFFENGLFYKRTFSLYDALQVDSPAGNQAVAAPGLGIGRNFLTARFMPHPRVEFSASYNYFRDIPTFDPSLIGTGLLDKYLFQGFSGGVRVEVLKQIWLYTDLGRSNRSGDTTNSLNQLYGITFGQVPWLHMRADAHYSRFNSSFGSGSYEAVSLSRNLRDTMHFELLGGQQNFTSQYTSNTNSKFITTNFDFNLGMHYFFQGGFTVSRGATMDYDQWMLTLGYRFDSKRFKAQ